MVQIFGVLFAAGGTLIGALVGFYGISQLPFIKDKIDLIKMAKKGNTYTASDVTNTIGMFFTLFGGFCGMLPAKCLNL